MDVDRKSGLLLTRCKDIVLVLDTPKGRGVFASAFIPAGTVIDTCPVLVLDEQENKIHIEKTELYHYTYNWPIKTTTNPEQKRTATIRSTQAVVLGLGSMFNHSSRDQNVGWTRDTQQLLITYHASRDINAGEELNISYGARLTFVDADPPSPVDEGDGSEMLSQIELG
ncbi:hypothetical protein K461DRAFT_179107 [Myriangium duriaei CBS 260.36]|uniref:SET domain-containing protein n=1 Tax=Myriangium duriaei CBS 260.36 TaxID=1168546 RepID=A0A9P4ME13_9PEZI|nr:hypothetical protein K461DRAFT_179107 [Myriangium duriaei CBS 260.36]